MADLAWPGPVGPGSGRRRRSSPSSPARLLVRHERGQSSGGGRLGGARLARCAGPRPDPTAGSARAPRTPARSHRRPARAPAGVHPGPGTKADRVLRANGPTRRRLCVKRPNEASKRTALWVRPHHDVDVCPSSPPWPDQLESPAQTRRRRAGPRTRLPGPSVPAGARPPRAPPAFTPPPAPKRTEFCGQAARRGEVCA